METISSVIVRTKEDYLESLASELEKIENLEVGIKEKDTIIILLTTKTTEEQIAIFQKVQGLKGVMDIQMHYSYSDELDLSDNVDFKDVLEDINQEKDAKSISYSGHMHKVTDSKKPKRS
ncbi:chaperone NapD [Helicobacter sp. 11S02629-2]|uniref:chaperone NapD n=1 Tax=Helicobacter sp. 11S02629-2 TaxID=1476195 RepID=UPI000BD42BBA|nr:chaperone NapD [Helicobacter sp. 11S02629-2]PAF45771.1 hypothetical protein BKH40_02540 [Helicobacter sp. 11S02629-2]